MISATVFFILSAVAVVAAGTALTRAADAIAERTGLGRAWIGLILLATATSLPEVATDIAAVRLGALDLAAGDLFGSSMANMLILALLGLVPPRNQVFERAALDHALSASLAIVLNATAAMLILSPLGASAFGIGMEAVVLLAIFFAGTLVVFRQNKLITLAAATAGVVPPVLPQPHVLTLRRAILRFAGASLAILLVAPVFAQSAHRIAELSGLGQTFVGTLLVGLSTSLPELVTALTAVRLGAFDLAVGNLFGSNAFNMVVFVFMDAAHPGALFAALDKGHALTALFAVVLMAIGLAAIVFRAERRHALVEPGSLLMVLSYLAGIWALYDYSAR
ncbi:MAG: hypothetical protein KJZ74_12520 [Gemmatimonadales bacterium]|nr:hypothetical protein [Gemmatimonadota bacterium]MCL4214726.1 hypothetical protein [Gemmatimonadales bacterium]